MTTFYKRLRSIHFNSPVLGGATAITKYHRLDGLNKRHLFLSILEVESPRSRCQPIWFLVRALSWLADDGFLAASSCGRREEERALVFLPLLTKTLIPPWGPTLMISAKPNCLQSFRLQIPPHWGLGLQTRNFLEVTSIPIIT